MHRQVRSASAARDDQRQPAVLGHCDEPHHIETFRDEHSLDVRELSQPDITSAHVRRGEDRQGIPWNPTARRRYRADRSAGYPNYFNKKLEVDAARPAINAASIPLSGDAELMHFHRSCSRVRAHIVHFQLRNLVWAASCNDVFLMHDNCLKHWSGLTRPPKSQLSHVIDARAGGDLRGMGRAYISTCCAHEDLVAVGGFAGELAVRRLGSRDLACLMRVTDSDNAITNGLEMRHTRSGGTQLMACNNDDAVRVFDAGSGFKCTGQWCMGWPANFAATNPHLPVVAVVGDHPEAQLREAGSGQVLSQLVGHADFSFAAAWHPAGHLLATGNQDTTVRLWDLRRPGCAVGMVRSCMAAPRSIRFSPDGHLCAVAEAADFVHIIDVQSGFRRSQTIDVFGEIAGISFSPDGSSLFVGVCDPNYSSLLEYRLGPEAGQRHV